MALSFRIIGPCPRNGRSRYSCSMESDVLVEIDRFVGTGTIVSNDTGETTDVSCRIFLSKRLLWCGDGEPRIEGGRESTGTVSVPCDKYWARRHLGKRFSLQFGHDKCLHFFIRESEGSAAHMDSTWKCEAR
jgi:hypothetical protein